MQLSDTCCVIARAVWSWSNLKVKDQAVLWICMSMFWGNALHYLSCVLRWKSGGLRTANDTWRSTQRTLVILLSSPPATSLDLDAGIGGICKERPPRPRESGATEGGKGGGLDLAFKSGRGEQEAQARDQEPRTRSTEFEKSYFVWMTGSCWSINVKRIWKC